MNPYDPNSLESLLALEESVPVQIRFVEDRQVVPYWLAKEVEAVGMGRLKIPLQYKDKFLTALSTDPMATALQRAPYYFPIGLQLTRPREEDDDDEGLEEDEPDTPPGYLDLIRIFQARYISIVDRAVNWRREDNPFLSKLTVKEKNIYHAAHALAVEFSQWRSGKEPQPSSSSSSAPSSSSSLSGKRKRSDVLF